MVEKMGEVELKEKQVNEFAHEYESEMEKVGRELSKLARREEYLRREEEEMEKARSKSVGH